MHGDNHVHCMAEHCKSSSVCGGLLGGGDVHYLSEPERIEGTIPYEAGLVDVEGEGLDCVECRSALFLEQPALHLQKGKPDASRQHFQDLQRYHRQQTQLDATMDHLSRRPERGLRGGEQEMLVTQKAIQDEVQYDVSDEVQALEDQEADLGKQSDQYTHYIAPVGLRST